MKFDCLEKSVMTIIYESFTAVEEENLIGKI
jgi:hypothetical protein